jgi:hypothetical protein
VSIGQLRFWCDANEIEYTFAGNWHAYQHFDSKDEPSAVIPGTLAPAGFQEPDQSRVGWMVVFDTASMQRVQRIPIKGPRWFTVDVRQESPARVMLPQSATTALITTRMYIRIKTGRAQVELDEAMRMRDAYEASGNVAVVEIDEDAHALVQDAAKAALAASQGEGPVADYAELVAISEPGTREGVARRLAEYRKGAL